MEEAAASAAAQAEVEEEDGEEAEEEEEEEEEAPEASAAAAAASSSSASFTSGVLLGAPSAGAGTGRFVHTWQEHLAADAVHRFRSGPWSRAEDVELLAAYDSYCVSHGLGSGAERLRPLEATRGKSKGGCWLEVAASIQYRTVRSVSRRAIRLLSPDNHKGLWSQEERQKLLLLHARHGPAWKAIGAELGRLPATVSVMYHRLAERAKKASESASAGGGSGSGGGGGGEGDSDSDSDDSSSSSSGSSIDESAFVRKGKKKPVKRRKAAAKPAKKRGAALEEEEGEEEEEEGLGAAAAPKQPAWSAQHDRALLDALLDDEAEAFEDVQWDGLQQRSGLLQGLSGAALQQRWDTLQRSRLPAQMPFARAVDALDRVVQGRPLAGEEL